MDRMDIRKLSYLIEVIERGSIGKAATMLRISQPALTKGLRLLEAEVDAKLLDRSPSGVAPTEFGRSLYAHAKSVVAELDRARTEIARLKGKENKYVRIASLPSISALVGRGVARTLTQQQDTLIRVIEMQNYQLLPALRRGECDFAIGLGEPAEPETGVRARVFARDWLAFTVRSGHPLLKRKKVELADLVDFPWVFPIVGTNHFFPAIRQIFVAAGLKAPVPRIETGSMQFVKSVILQSDAIAILAQHVTDEELKVGTLARLPIDSPLLKRTITLFDRIDSPLSYAARVVLDEIERSFKDWERLNPEKLGA
jgi:LysR family pca operon transcriptional activator